ncbi:MAG: hypothetical protein GX660_28700 [Clostridiaceae bacterium]|nr:hypothetical protein [Clostridiaceae bacterium]
MIIAFGSYHIAAFLYKKLFSSMSQEQIEDFARNFSYPDTIKEEHKNAINHIEEGIKEQNISREKFAQYFKSQDSYTHVRKA